MAKGKYDRESCLKLLYEKQRVINESGETRYPKRTDFTEEEVVAIKAFLGPWPRALEAASIKHPRSDNRRELNIEKRIRSKRRRTEAKKTMEKSGKR